MKQAYLSSATLTVLFLLGLPNAVLGYPPPEPGEGGERNECICLSQSDNTSCALEYGPCVETDGQEFEAFYRTCQSTPCYGHAGHCEEQPAPPLTMDVEPDLWNLLRSAYREREPGDIGNGIAVESMDPFFCADEVRCSGGKWLGTRTGVPAGHYCGYELVGRKPIAQYQGCTDLEFDCDGE